MVLYSTRTQNAIRELAAITRQYQDVAEGARKTASSPVRHKVFVSYHAADAVEVVDFIAANTDVFIPRAIGMEEDGSDIIDSTNVAYIRQTIRSKFLKDSTVTLLAVGECTWARKFVDWELYTTILRMFQPLDKLSSFEVEREPLAEMRGALFVVMGVCASCARWSCALHWWIAAFISVRSLWMAMPSSSA